MPLDSVFVKIYHDCTVLAQTQTYRWILSGLNTSHRRRERTEEKIVRGTNYLNTANLAVRKVVCHFELCLNRPERPQE